MSDPRQRLLTECRSPYLIFECRRCRRHGQTSVRKLHQAYGNKPLGEIARLIAADGGCAFADTPQSGCTAIPVEPPVHHWADLGNARYGKWQALLYCERRMAALKATNACPGPIALDVPTLVAALGYAFKLERLPTRLCCPACGTKAVRIEWLVPEEPAPPRAH